MESPGFEASSRVPEDRFVTAEAGEPALAIQLYARLLARYPDSALGIQARAAVEAQKKKLVVKS